MASGSANLIAFETTLDQLDVRYAELEESTVPALRIGYSMTNMDHLDVFFWFDEDGGTMHYGTSTVAHVPEAKTEVALQAINEVNRGYRWLTFYLDGDHDIVASGDHILAPDVVGDTCFELLSRTLSICDEAYTSFMKALWAS